MKTKVVQWDEHNADDKNPNIPVLVGENHTDEYFYNYCKEYNTYILFHNIEA